MLRRTWRDFLSRSLHVGDAELLAFLDGELRSRRADQVRNHLEACWNCRARRQKMEKAITWFVEADAESIVASPPPRNWREFELKFDRLIAERQDNPTADRTVPWFRIPLPRAALALGCVLVCAAAVKLWTGRPEAPHQTDAVSRTGRANHSGPAFALPPDVAESAKRPSTPTPSSGVAVPKQVSSLEVEGKAIELESALHGLRACIGAEVQVERAANGTLDVRGTVLTQAREAQILAALADVPMPAWVSLRIRTAEHASGRVRDIGAGTGGPSEIRAGRLPIEERLQGYLREHPEAAGSSSDAVALLSGRILTHASSSVREAWALRRLVEQYADNGLDAPHRRMLAAMLRDHLTAMGEQERSASALLGPVLVVSTDPVEGNGELPTWPLAALRAFDEIVQFEHYVSVLFGGDTADVDGDEVVRRLEALLPRLEGTLRSADRQLTLRYSASEYR